MVLEPSLVVADGRVFMLDVSLRARIVRLMLSCGKGADLTYVLSRTTSRRRGSLQREPEHTGRSGRKTGR